MRLKELKELKIRNLTRIIGGGLFAILLIPLAWLLFLGIAKLLKSVSGKLPSFLAVILIALMFFIVIVLTAISKIYIGGGSTQMFFKNFHKKKRMDADAHAKLNDKNSD